MNAAIKATVAYWFSEWAVDYMVGSVLECLLWIIRYDQP
jgi:hypothetical protein